LSAELSTARAVVYRLLRTLEAHRLIGRTESRYVLGIGIAELASRLRPRLQATVLPILRRLSAETGSTALLSVADGDQALILQSGATGIAAPIVTSDWASAGIGVVQLAADVSDSAVPQLVVAAATEAARRLLGGFPQPQCVSPECTSSPGT